MAHQDPTWTVIPDFEGHQVNSSGEIRNIASGVLLKTSVNQSGVRYVSVRNTTLRRYQNMAVSVIVASTFCEGRTPQTETVLHRNGDTEDNRAENLMWASRFHTIQYHREITAPRPVRGRRVQLYVDGEPSTIYKDVFEAAMATGCLPSNISYAATYNDELVDGVHMNFVQRVWPGGHVFKTA
jgi:hypothetical protein